MRVLRLGLSLQCSINERKDSCSRGILICHKEVLHQSSAMQGMRHVRSRLSCRCDYPESFHITSDHRIHKGVSARKVYACNRMSLEGKIRSLKSRMTSGAPQD